MNVLRQQMIARVVVTAFFEKSLSRDDQVRRAAADYLERSISSEIPEVSYTRSASAAGR
jgi:hypothetical protein